MKKKMIVTLVVLLPYMVFSQEPVRNRYSRYNAEKKLPERYELLLNGPKIKLQKLNPVPDYDLLLDQRLVFLPGRSIAKYNQKYKFAGISLGNGLFLDADYNLGLSMEKFFKENLNSRKKYRVVVSRYRNGKVFEENEYIRDESALKQMRKGKPSFQIDFKDDEIHLKKYGIMKVVDGRLMYFLTPRGSEPVMGQIAREKNTVVYQLDNPSSKIILGENSITAEVPSDFFLSELYEFRTFNSLKISESGDVVTVKSTTAGTEKDISIFQNQDGLYIISNSGKSYHVKKGEDNKISVYHLLPAGERKLMQVEIISSEPKRARKK